MKHMRRFALAAALAFVGATAFAQDVKTDFDKDANFAAIKTFTAKIGTSWNNPISEKRVTDEIEQTLTEKGWKKVDAKADALVLLHGATEKQKSLNTFYSRRLRRLRLPRLGRHGRHGHRHHDDLRVPRRHPGRGHLRREVEGAHVPGHRHGRDLGQAGEEHEEARQGHRTRCSRTSLRDRRRRSRPRFFRRRAGGAPRRLAAALFSFECAVPESGGAVTNVNPVRCNGNLPCCYFPAALFQSTFSVETTQCKDPSTSSRVMLVGSYLAALPYSWRPSATAGPTPGTGRRPARPSR